MKRFHLHIYFKPTELEKARVLAGRAQRMHLFDVVKFHEHPIGPHPTGTIEGHFGDAAYSSVLEWVEANRGDFSTLIHQDTGDDFKDHTDGCSWLGQELLLDFSFFQLIQLRPELRINHDVTDE